MAVRQLSRREHEVLVLIGEAYTNQEIAEALHLTKQSTKNLVTRLMIKHGAKNRTELALMRKAAEQREGEHICRFTGQHCGGGDCQMWSKKFKICLLVEVVEAVMTTHS